MAYIANTDITQRLGSATLLQLADDDGDGVADTGIVDEARLGAEGELNSYLARRFRVPIDLSAHPELTDVLMSVTLDLVEYRLRGRRPPMPEDTRRKRTAAIEWLRGIADGSIGLPSVSQVATNTNRGLLGHAGGEERLLSRDELSGH